MKKPKIKYIEPISSEEMAEMYNATHDDSKISIERMSIAEFKEKYGDIPTEKELDLSVFDTEKLNSRLAQCEKEEVNDVEKAFKYLDDALSELKFLLDLHNKNKSMIDADYADYQTCGEAMIGLAILKSKIKP